jgi:myo-inositol 2-dehydrogenase / D-chiro-inositol 1-dehydrogenase
MGKQGINRRDFIEKSTRVGSTALAGFSILGNAQAAPSKKLKIGVVGIGGRGSGAIRDVLSCNAHGENVEVVALGDYFLSQMTDRIPSIKKAVDKEGFPGFNVTPDRCYSGWDAYKKVIDSDVDIVFLTTPPQFRPQHMEYAVNAGKHVFSEKPVAVDPVGIRKYMKAGEKAKAKGQAVLGGTQRRHQPPYVEAMKRIHRGDIGDVISAHIYWNTNDIWFRDRKPGMNDRDFWMYNWYHVDFLCGDHIVEQHLHQFDVVNWVFHDQHPVKAYGMGGRQKHTERGGNIYDHFAVEYEYPDGQRVTSMCRQISGTDGKIAEDIVGTKGKGLLLHRDPKCRITGENPWRWTGGNHRSEYQLEHQAFLASIRENNPINDAKHLAQGTMMAILGREAAYTGKVITWDELMKSDLSLAPADIENWNGKMRPVHKPGTKRA